MEEMASAMRAVDTSAETTANLSREVVNKAELGQAKVVQTIEGMEAIREASDVAEKVIRGLGARTIEIGGILDVIDDVADETNLLALNAAIIAAQAGEQGKAFSVVADEIKELADRVLASTKEIGGLIGAVQLESENAIGAIEAGSASVMSGVDLSAEAGRTLEEITVASRESGLRIGEIVASVREQTKAASRVVGLMERVREASEEIGVAGSEQEQGNEIVYQSALTMREVAQHVRRTSEEQAAGFSRLSENVVGVREAIGQITSSLNDQTGDCGLINESLALVSQGTRANEEATEKLQEAMREFTTKAVALREDAERFRV
jgi:methyl-accepting chemotaxis protein